MDVLWSPEPSGSLGFAGEHNEEVVGEDICCAEMENAVFHTRDHLSVVLHQFPIEDNGCGQQPGFITQPIEQDVSDAEAHLHDNVEQKVTDHSFSSLDPIDQVCNHQRSLDDTSISDVNKCSVGSELLLSSVSRSCDDHTDNNEYRYPEVVQVNTLESRKHVEVSSPINEFNADLRCTLVVMQPDSCGSTDKICTSFEEVVQVPVEVQPDSLVCHDVKTKDILLHMNVEQAAIGYSFSNDKTLDLPHTANFGAQDGQVENVVYDALNNHVQQECFETKTYVGVPYTVVILSPPTVANSSKDMNQQSGTMNVDICRSVDDQEPREDIFAWKPADMPGVPREKPIGKEVANFWQPTSFARYTTPSGSLMLSWCPRRTSLSVCASISSILIRSVRKTISCFSALIKSLIRLRLASAYPSLMPIRAIIRSTTRYLSYLMLHCQKFSTIGTHE
ncbi:hypothetical protein ZWY2020_041156, partial [Hordeum vulgare]